MKTIEEFAKLAVSAKTYDELLELYHDSISGRVESSIEPFNLVFIDNAERIDCECDPDIKRIMSAPPEKKKPCFPKGNGAKPFTDHLGNVFPCFKDFAEHYDLDPRTVKCRLEKGMTVKQAVESATRKVKDHLGNGFKSFNSMARYYNIRPSALKARLKTHSLKEALEMGASKKNRWR